MKSPCLLFRASLFVFLCLCVSVYSAALDSPSGSDQTPPPAPSRRTFRKPAPVAGASVAIPGPLRSFLRMAGISQKISHRGSAASAGAQCRGGRLSGAQGQDGQAHRISDLAEAVRGTGQATGHAGGPGRNHSSFQLRAGGPLLAIFSATGCGKVAGRTLRSKPPIRRAPF